jgi:hypothetical protein
MILAEANQASADQLFSNLSNNMVAAHGNGTGIDNSNEKLTNLLLQ